MNFRTRLLITFFTIILLPLALAVTAFLFIGNYLSKSQEEYGFKNRDYNILIDPNQASRMMSDEIFYSIKDNLSSNPALLEDFNVLTNIDKQIEERASYIIVRKDEELYFTGNQLASEQIFSKLPEFEEENIYSSMAQGVYYDDMNKIVRQMDFYFSDGSQGSLFYYNKSKYDFDKNHVCGHVHCYFIDFDNYKYFPDTVDQ